MKLIWKRLLWIVILIKITLLTTVEEFEWASAHCLNTCHVELPKKPGYPIHSFLSHKWISCIQHSDICFLLNQLWLPSTSLQSNGHWCGCLSWERSPSTCFHLEAKKYYWASKQIHKWQPSQQWPKRNFTSPLSWLINTFYSRKVRGYCLIQYKFFGAKIVRIVLWAV